MSRKLVSVMVVSLWFLLGRGRGRSIHVFVWVASPSPRLSVLTQRPNRMKRLLFEYGVDGARAIGINLKAGMTVQETFECLPEEVVRTPPDDTPQPGRQIRLNVNPRTKKYLGRKYPACRDGQSVPCGALA